MNINKKSLYGLVLLSLIGLFVLSGCNPKDIFSSKVMSKVDLSNAGVDTITGLNISSSTVKLADTFNGVVISTVNISVLDKFEGPVVKIDEVTVFKNYPKVGTYEKIKKQFKDGVLVSIEEERVEESKQKDKGTGFTLLYVGYLVLLGWVIYLTGRKK